MMRRLDAGEPGKQIGPPAVGARAVQIDGDGDRGVPELLLDPERIGAAVEQQEWRRCAARRAT